AWNQTNHACCAHQPRSRWRFAQCSRSWRLSDGGGGTGMTSVTACFSPGTPFTLSGGHHDFVAHDPGLIPAKFHTAINQSGDQPGPAHFRRGRQRKQPRTVLGDDDVQNFVCVVPLDVTLPRRGQIELRQQATADVEAFTAEPHVRAGAIPGSLRVDTLPDRTYHHRPGLLENAFLEPHILNQQFTGCMLAPGRQPRFCPGGQAPFSYRHFTSLLAKLSALSRSQSGKCL